MNVTEKSLKTKIPDPLNFKINDLKSILWTSNRKINLRFKKYTMPTTPHICIYCLSFMIGGISNAQTLTETTERIFVLKNQDNKTAKVSVKKGRESDDQVEIFDDLKVDDQLVSSPSEEMQTGQSIQP
jgi:hypothetical protein